MSEKAILNPFTGLFQKILDDATLATAQQITDLQNDVVNLGFRTSINGDYAEFGMSGKTIDEYDGADCGVFRLNGMFFNAMREAMISGEDSISAAVRKLIFAKNMEAVYIEKDEQWFDIDTPEAYQDFLRKWNGNLN